MTCFNPISLKPVYVVNENTGEITDTPGRNVPCGKCIGCLNQKRSQWTSRLQNEVKNATKAVFITLTYNDESIPMIKKGLKYAPTLKKRELQLYFKRIRKYEKNLKYYAVGEYGSQTQRPHYHALVIGVEDNLLIDKWVGEQGSEIEGQSLGHIRIDRISDALIHYLTKYMINDEWDKENDIRIKPFAIMSKGLGRAYINEAGTYHKTARTFISLSPGGVKYCISRYHKERIFTPEERNEITKENKERFSLADQYKRNEKLRKEKTAIKRRAQKQSKSNKV